VIRLYSPETVIAEKFNAMIVLGMANSRMKDYFDIWMLSQNFTIEAEVLREAVRQTFSKRQTELPKKEPQALSTEFVNNASKQSQWNGFIRRQRRINNAPALHEIIEILKTFLLPIVSSFDGGKISVKTWFPGQGWTPKQ
jgi:hypothetical protein